MKSRPRLATAAALAAALQGPLTVTPAQAQGFSVQAAAPHFRPDQAAAFSKQIERDLAERGAHVAMVFQTGTPRDRLPQGISFTHGAFWIYRTITTADGAVIHGYAVYNLYAGDGKAWPVIESRLVQNWPLDFVRGSAVDDVAVIVPTPDLQRRLLAVIDSPAYEALHNPAFSLVANPWEQRYQNCNAFMLDVMGDAIWNTDDRGRITADLKAYFKPTIVAAGPLQRFFGPLTDPRLRHEDQHGPIRTTTYESLTGFLKENDLLQENYVIRYAG